jgi:YtkA-like protein
MAWNQLKNRGGPEESAATAIVVRTIRSGDLDILVRSPAGMFRRGRNAFTIEFRSVNDGALVDVGTVRASANMPMPGMVMPSGVQVQRSGTPGRYEGTAEFGMAGAWQMAIEWNGRAGQGQGSVSFEGAVQ